MFLARHFRAQVSSVETQERHEQCELSLWYDWNNNEWGVKHHSFNQLYWESIILNSSEIRWTSYFDRCDNFVLSRLNWLSIFLLAKVWNRLWWQIVPTERQSIHLSENTSICLSVVFLLLPLLSLLSRWVLLNSLPNNKIRDWSKYKAFADSLNVAKMAKFVFGYHHFLRFQQ